MRSIEETLSIRALYPAGSRVQLKKMSLPIAPPVGTTGIVTKVDILGTVHVKWSNGSRISVVVGEDEIIRIA